MICQHALSHLNVCICHVMVQKLCFLMHFWLVVLLLGICKCVCVMHCHRQMISLQTFYKWFFFQCSHGKKKRLLFLFQAAKCVGSVPCYMYIYH